MSEDRLLTRNFTFLTAGHFLQALGFATMVLLPLYLDFLEASRAEIGFIMATSAVGGLLLRPVVGWALDVVGRRPTLLAGTVVLSVSMGLIGLVDQVGPLIYVVRALYGVGVGTLFTAYFTFASDIVPVRRRTEGIALFGVSGLLPLVFNPFIRQAGIDAPDLQWFFPVVGAIIGSSLLFVLLLREPEREHAGKVFRPSDAIMALRASSLWPVWLATTVFATLVAVFMAFATVTAVHRGVELAAAIWLTYGSGAIGVRLFGARLPDRVGPERLVAPALGVYTAAALVCALATGTAGFLLAGLLAGIAHGYCFPVLTAQVIDRIPDRVRGSGIATFTALWDLSALCLTPVFGLIADTWSDRALFITAAAASLLGIGLWWALERRYGILGAPSSPPRTI